jgi:two-component system sensor histidine kinase KdpD
VFLGTAVGVGKTYAMLNEGRRLAESGEDAVIGYWERHNRPKTETQVHDLELIPPRHVPYRGASFEELDVDAVISRFPDVVLVDELAHSRITDGRPRWKDVEDIRRAGIDVITTVNVANLETVREFAAEVTGAGSVESVPDDMLRDARVELIGLPPDVLRRRVADGHVYSSDRVGGALANYFTFENLSALNELGQAWMAGTLDDEGPSIVARYTSTGPRALVIAGVSGRDGSVAVVRKAVQRAESADADLVVVHVVDALGDGGQSNCLDEVKDLVHSLGARYHEIRSEDSVDGIAIAVSELGATTVVIGRHRSRLVQLLRGAVARRLRARLPGVTVETVEHA